MITGGTAAGPSSSGPATKAAAQQGHPPPQQAAQQQAQQQHEQQQHGRGPPWPVRSPGRGLGKLAAIGAWRGDGTEVEEVVEVVKGRRSCQEWASCDSSGSGRPLLAACDMGPSPRRGVVTASPNMFRWCCHDISASVVVDLLMTLTHKHTQIFISVKCILVYVFMYICIYCLWHVCVCVWWYHVWVLCVCLCVCV